MLYKWSKRSSAGRQLNSFEGISHLDGDYRQLDSASFGIEVSVSNLEFVQRLKSYDTHRLDATFDHFEAGACSILGACCVLWVVNLVFTCSHQDVGQASYVTSWQQRCLLGALKYQHLPIRSPVPSAPTTVLIAVNGWKTTNHVDIIFILHFFAVLR